jgi:hypothetical protein
MSMAAKLRTLGSHMGSASLSLLSTFLALTMININGSDTSDIASGKAMSFSDYQ